MSGIARNHHYLPQCYLSGFARAVERKNSKPSVWVFDVSNGRRFPTSIRNIGAIRDFNRIEVDGHRPDVIETLLSTIETDFARVLSNMNNDLRLPDDEGLTFLFNLIALISSHNPSFREIHNRFQSDVLNQMLGATLADEGRWLRQVERMKSEGIDVDETVNYEQMKSFYREGAYTLEFENTHNLKLEFEAMDTILQTLVDRKWTLAIAPLSEGHFITCDYPASLTWTNDALASGPYPPGHGMKDTLLTFPISSRLAMLGEFEGTERCLELSRDQIAAINSTIAAYAIKQIYSSMSKVPIMSPMGVIEINKFKKRG